MNIDVDDATVKMVYAEYLRHFVEKGKHVELTKDQLLRIYLILNENTAE